MRAFLFRSSSSRLLPVFLLWTVGGLARPTSALATALVDMSSALACFPTSHPFAFGVSVTCAKTMSADWLVQKRTQIAATTPQVLDKKRLAMFGIYGGVYLGMFQYCLYNFVYPKLFPLTRVFANAGSWENKLAVVGGVRSVFTQTLFDDLVHSPFLAIPVFYILQELVQPSSAEQSLVHNVKRKLRSNWFADVRIMWKIWVPATLFNFGCLPPHLQVPFTALISFFYTGVMSLLRGSSKNNNNDTVATAS